MEQASMVTAMLQTVANTTELPKAGGKGDGSSNDFQKLLDEKSQVKDTLPEDQPKTQTTAASDKKTVSPAQKQENALERLKKLAEQGYPMLQPAIAAATLDGQVYQPGEWVEVWTPTGAEIIPLTGLDEAQMQQVQQILDAADPVQVIDVSDPEADAILEATAPGADNSPAAMLEKVTAEQFGKEIRQMTDEAQPQTQMRDTDDDLVETVEVEQAPQRLFHDVQAAPVKVGEMERPQQADEAGEADVVRQVENQVTQAVQNGESTVTVKLNPENLGEVTVQVSMKSDGVLNVAISARNDDTRALLERHAVNLQEMVSSRTQQSVEVNVQRQQESQQNQNQQNYDGHNGHAQDGQERRRRQHEQTDPQDFMQQLRLGLIPTDGEI